MKMKWCVAGAVALVIGAFAVFGTDLPSHVATWFDSGTMSIKDQIVSMEHEIERAELLLEDLEPEKKKAEKQIAEETVEVRKWNEQIEEQEERLALLETGIQKLAGDLREGDTEFVFGGESYDEQEAKRILKNNVETYKVSKQNLEADRKIHAAHQRAKVANEKHYKEIVQAEKDLKVKIAELRARLKSIKAEEAIAEVEIDDTALKRTRNLVDEIETKIETRETMLEQKGSLQGDVDLGEAVKENESTQDVLEEVDQLFGNDKSL